MQQNMISKIIEPKILSLITTEKCTAACHNCCFQCSPRLKQRMSLEDMKFLIDEVIKDFPMILACVFTGGECTTLGTDLHQIINYAAMLLKGDGIPINKEEGVKYIKMSADKGYKDAMITYGKMLRSGDGIPIYRKE